MANQRQNLRDQAPQPDPAQFAEDPGGAALAVREDQQFWTERQYAGLRALGIKGATRGDLTVFLHYCTKTGLDPFTRQIYLIMRRAKNRDTGEWEERPTIQVGIDGFRVIRDRAARKLGCEVEYEDTIWYDDDGGEHAVWLAKEPPAACKVVVIKVLDDGTRLRYPAVLRFDSYVPRDQHGNPTGQWAVQPEHQIEKCCEAFALRRGFPQDLAGIYAEEELAANEDGASRQPSQRTRRTVRSHTREESPRVDHVVALKTLMSENGLDTSEQTLDRRLLLRALISPEDGALVPDEPFTADQVKAALERYQALLNDWRSHGLDPVEQTAALVEDARAEDTAGVVTHPPEQV